MTNRPPGFYDDIPEADYHADRESLSVSGAKVLLKAPALFRWQQENPVRRDVFDIGSAAHALVLGVGADLEVIHYDDWRSKAAREERDAARAEGKTPILWGDYDRVCAMADALSSHHLAMQLLSDGKPEVSAYATDEATGVMRRCRFDFLGPNLAVDYKTSATANPAELGPIVARYGYHQQHAWYADVAADLGRPLDAFAFVFQQKDAPYLVSVIELDEAAVQRGRDLNRRALEMFRDCTESGVWPGYQSPDTYARVSLPRWAFYDNDLEENIA